MPPARVIPAHRRGIASFLCGSFTEEGNLCQRPPVLSCPAGVTRAAQGPQPTPPAGPPPPRERVGPCGGSWHGVLAPGDLRHCGWTGETPELRWALWGGGGPGDPVRRRGLRVGTSAFPRAVDSTGRPLRQGGRGGQARRGLAVRFTLCRRFVLPASYRRFSDCYKRLCQLQPDVTQRIHDKFVAQLQASVRVSGKEPSRGCWPSGSPGLSAALCGCGLPWPLSVLRRGLALVAGAGACACCPGGSCPPRVPSAQGAEATRNRGQPWTGLLRGMRKARAVFAC